MSRRFDIPEEDRQEYVKAILLNKATCKELAAQYGLHRNTLSNWVRLYSMDVIRDLSVENEKLLQELNELKHFKQTTLESIYFVDDSGIVKDG